MRNMRDEGASAVEFALVFPLLAMLLFGMITGGLALNQQQQINHAAREAARFGATLPGFLPPAADREDTFDLVASRAVNTAVAVLGQDEVFICVLFLDGDTPTRFWYSGTDPDTPVADPGLPCLDLLDGDSDTEPRLQVAMYAPARIEAIFFRRTLTLGADAISVYEPRVVSP